MPGKNRIVEAFKESYNTIGLAAVAAISLALLNPIPLLGALVAEAAYLLVVPDSRWFAARLARRYDSEVEEHRRLLKERTLPLLQPATRERFLRLEEVRKQIDTQAQDDKSWFREVLRKLDYLLEKFLVFSAKEAQFHAYLQSLRDEIDTSHSFGRGTTPRGGSGAGRRDARPDFDIPMRLVHSDSEPTPSQSDPSDSWTREAVEEVQSHYAREREKIVRQLEGEQDYDTRAVLEKRSSVLERRNEFAGKIGKILTNIHHQLQLVEDTFGLINDEIRARSPEQILADIEEVVVATDSMSSALEELAPLEQLAARVAS